MASTGTDLGVSLPQKQLCGKWANVMAVATVPSPIAVDWPSDSSNNIATDHAGRLSAKDIGADSPRIASGHGSQSGQSSRDRKGVDDTDPDLSESLLIQRPPATV